MMMIQIPDDEDAARLFGPGAARPGLWRRGRPSAGIQVPAQPLRRGRPRPDPAIQHLQRGLQVGNV